MALVDRTSIRRHGMAATVASVLTSLAVANAGPAWGQDTGDGDESPPANTFHAFLLDDGEFTTIDPPGASGELTFAIGINDHGQIVGYYLDACGTFHGFLRDKKGDFTIIDHPDSPLGTVALDINNRGEIVGVYGDAEETTHGFLRDRRGGFTAIDPPGASFTEAVGINGRGQIVGFYLDAEGTIHGFLRDRGRGARREEGVFTTIELPGALATSVDDINNRGQIVGTYSEVSNTRPLDAPRAYLLDDGAFTLIDAFGADNTQIGRINDRGEFVGAYFDAGGPTLGFLRDRRGGFTTIEVPGAEQTGAAGINNRGQIVGAYVDAAGTDPIFVCGAGASTQSTSQAPNMTSPPGSGMGEAMLP
jgi:uncharacterized membrane protein